MTITFSTQTAWIRGVRINTIGHANRELLALPNHVYFLLRNAVTWHWWMIRESIYLPSSSPFTMSICYSRHPMCYNSSFTSIVTHPFWIVFCLEAASINRYSCANHTHLSPSPPSSLSLLPAAYITVIPVFSLLFTWSPAPILTLSPLCLTCTLLWCPLRHSQR